MVKVRDENDRLCAGTLPEDPFADLRPLRAPAAGPVPEADPTLGPGRASVVRLADIAREPVRWLWRPYLPRRAVTLLEGDPGLGKSWTTVQLVAAVTTGRALPDATPSVTGPRNVLLLTAEDGLGDTVRPRLEDAGADLARVFAVQGLTAPDPVEPTREREFEISLANMDAIRDAVRRYEAVLVVVDPVQAYLGAGVDMHRSNEVRPLLKRLAAAMREHDAAAILVRHLNKGGGGPKGLYRGLGSIDFAAAARSVVQVSNHPAEPDDRGRRVLVHVKSNLAAKGQTLGFTLDAAGFRWTGPAEVSEEDVRQAEGRIARGTGRPTPGRPADRRAQAEDLLRDLLAPGPRLADQCYAQAEDQGVGERTLRRAARLLGVVMEGGHRNRPATWRLPDPPQGEVRENGGQNGGQNP